MDFTADVTINEQIRLVLEIDSLAITIKGIIDSARGNVSYWLINLAIAGVLGIVKGYINAFLKDGFDLNWIV